MIADATTTLILFLSHEIVADTYHT
jgi:hypothetical protein